MYKKKFPSSSNFNSGRKDVGGYEDRSRGHALGKPGTTKLDLVFASDVSVETK